jgi:hypothetical protein
MEMRKRVLDRERTGPVCCTLGAADKSAELSATDHGAQVGATDQGVEPGATSDATSCHAGSAATHLGTKIHSVEMCYLGAANHSAELRVHFPNSFHQGSNCELLSQKGPKSKKKSVIPTVCHLPRVRLHPHTTPAPPHIAPAPPAARPAGPAPLGASQLVPLGGLLQPHSRAAVEVRPTGVSSPAECHLTRSRDPPDEFSTATGRLLLVRRAPWPLPLGPFATAAGRLLLPCRAPSLPAPATFSSFCLQIRPPTTPVPLGRPILVSGHPIRLSMHGLGCRDWLV